MASPSAFASRLATRSATFEQTGRTEPWIRGGFAGFFPPGVLTEYRYCSISRSAGCTRQHGDRPSMVGNIEAALQFGRARSERGPPEVALAAKTQSVRTSATTASSVLLDPNRCSRGAASVVRPSRSPPEGHCALIQRE